MPNKNTNSFNNDYEQPVMEVGELKKRNLPSTKPSKKKEKIKQERAFIILALILVFSILFGTLIRVNMATPYISPEDIMDFTGVTCAITDRFEQPIYKDGAVTNYDIYGNIVGYKDHIHNSLLYRHFDLLVPSKINSITGYRTVETKPRVMKTTLLSEESQKELAKLFGDTKGCCFSYNYETGEIYTALSFPACNPANENSEYINRCFQSVYIPGSTMKIVTAAIAIDQGKNVNKLTYECDKNYELSDGNVITCAGIHGTIGFSEAIGKSCNHYFAQLITELNLDKALNTLSELGFTVNGAAEKEELIDSFTRKNSSVNITNTTSFKNIWGLIGQGHTQANPIQMAQIAAAVVNEGEAAKPFLVATVTNPNKKNAVIHTAKTEAVKLLSAKTAKKTAIRLRKNTFSYVGKSPAMRTLTFMTAKEKEDRIKKSTPL